MVSPKDKKLPPQKPFIENNIDKTVVDLDLNQLKDKLNETAIYELPPQDSEQTSLHFDPSLEQKKMDLESSEDESLKNSPDEMQTSFIKIEESEEEEPPLHRGFTEQEEFSGSVSTPLVDRLRMKFRLFDKLLFFFETVFSFLHPYSERYLEFFLGGILSLFLLSGLATSLFYHDRFSLINGSLFFIAFGVNLFFILKKRRFVWGIEATLGSILIVSILTLKKLISGGGVAHPFGWINQPFFWILFYLFLLLASFWIYLSTLKKAFQSFRFIFAAMIVYGTFGFLEAILGSVWNWKAWSLFDLLIGTEKWSWIPWYFIRPVSFSLVVLLPVLFFVLLGKILFSFWKGRGRLLRLEMTFLATLFLSNVLSGLILSYQGLGNWLTPFLGTGLGSISFSIHDGEKVILFPGKKTSKAPLQFIFSETEKESGKRIKVAIRREGGGGIPFLGLNDWLFQSANGQSRPLQVLFNEEKILKAKHISFLIDRSEGMSSKIPMIEKGLLRFFSFLNSRDSILWIKFGEDLQSLWIKKTDQLQEELSRLYGYGSSRLLPALEEGIHKNPYGTFLIFTSGIQDLSQIEEKSKTWGSLPKIFLFWISKDPVPNSFNQLIQRSNGKVFSVTEKEEVESALQILFSEEFGEYEIQR